MTEANKNVAEQLKNSYLSSIQRLQFSKDDDKSSTEVAEIERSILFAKCCNAVKLGAVPTLLQESLDTYRNIVDETAEVNNYWQEFKNKNLNVKNDPLKWVSGLSDISKVLSFVKPLPCQSNVTNNCKNLNYNNRHIENFINSWKEERKPVTLRKTTSNLSSVQQSDTRIGTVKQQTATNTNVYNNDSYNNALSGSSNSLLQQYNKNPNHSRNMSSNNTKVLVNSSKGQMNNGFKTDQVANNEGSINKVSGFKTAREELNIQLAQKNRQAAPKKTLGCKTSIHSKYICPLRRESDADVCNNLDQTDNNESEEVDERLKNIDAKMIELIKNEIMDSGSVISWSDIAGLEYAKKIIQEIVVFPMLRPDIFTGLRRPPKGILLFGPPGTGKTLIGKCIASQSKSTFFSISASSLTSKWIGEGEKMVRALFAVARVYQPSVVFIDEIDSLLTQRSETEHESSRRIKTEFLVQLDGAATGEEDRILIVGATNRPYELDEAARRRLVKRLYIPLPEHEARGQIVQNLLKSERHDLTLENINEIAELTQGYSGADVTNLCKEASMGPIRSIPFDQLENISKEEVRRVTMQDFIDAIKCVRPSVSQSDLSVYLEWDKTYGSGSTIRS